MPNPVREAAAVSFDLPREGIELAAFDVAGRRFGNVDGGTSSRGMAAPRTID